MLLKPAQLYREELKKALVACWYEPKYRWYFGSGRYEHQLPDNTEWKQDFVHVNNEGKVDGYFGYSYNDISHSITNFGLIGMADNNWELVSSALRRIEYLFLHGAQRAEFWCYEDNPVKRWYDKIVTKYGGKQIATLHRVDYFDGRYHNMCVYEILVEDYRRVCAQRAFPGLKAIIGGDIQ